MVTVQISPSAILMCNAKNNGNFIIMQIGVTVLTFSFENLLCVFTVWQNPHSVTVHTEQWVDAIADEIRVSALLSGTIWFCLAFIWLLIPFAYNQSCHLLWNGETSWRYIMLIKAIYAFWHLSVLRQQTCSISGPHSRSTWHSSLSRLDICFPPT